MTKSLGTRLPSETPKWCQEDQLWHLRSVAIVSPDCMPTERDGWSPSEPALAPCLVRGLAAVRFDPTFPPPFPCPLRLFPGNRPEEALERDCPISSVCKSLCTNGTYWRSWSRDLDFSLTWGTDLLVLHNFSSHFSWDYRCSQLPLVNCVVWQIWCFRCGNCEKHRQKCRKTKVRASCCAMRVEWIVWSSFIALGKGGKNRRRGKNENESEKRELVFKEDGQG